MIQTPMQILAGYGNQAQAPAQAEAQQDYAMRGRFYLPELAVDRESEAYRKAFELGKDGATPSKANMYMEAARLAAALGSAGVQQYLRGNMMADRRRAANRVNLMADQGQSSEQALANAERRFSAEDPNFDYAPRSVVPGGRRAWSNKVGGF